jgi:Flp pilus assembly protein CpaB
LTRQLVMPVVGLVLAAVLANVGFSAWLAARRSAAATRAAQQQVADALQASRVSLSAAVLDALHRLTANHFLIWNESIRQPGLTTLPTEVMGTLDGDRVAAALRAGNGTFGGKRYQIGAVRSEGVRPETVLVLTPARGWLAALSLFLVCLLLYAIIHLVRLAQGHKPAAPPSARATAAVEALPVVVPSEALPAALGPRARDAARRGAAPGV